MAVDIYSKTAWNNGTAPSISKTQLDHIETGIKNNNTAIISLQSVQAECENYASEAEASKIASASSATSSASSALSALTSANTAKAEADRAVAVAGVDIATDLVAGLVRGGGNVEVDANGDMNVPVANNLTTTSEGYVLDARQGKALNDSLTQKFSQMGSTFKQLRWIELTADIAATGGSATVTLAYTPSISASNIPIICLSATTFQGCCNITAGSKTANIVIWKDSAITTYNGWIRLGTLLPCAD